MDHVVPVDRLNVAGHGDGGCRVTVVIEPGVEQGLAPLGPGEPPEVEGTISTDQELGLPGIWEIGGDSLVDDDLTLLVETDVAEPVLTIGGDVAPDEVDLAGIVDLERCGLLDASLAEAQTPTPVGGGFGAAIGLDGARGQHQEQGGEYDGQELGWSSRDHFALSEPGTAATEVVTTTICLTPEP
jgi:hypothetical protein